VWCCGGRLSAFFFISHTNGFLSSFSLTLPAFYHRAAQIPCKAQPKSTHTNLNQKQITNTILQTRGVAGGFVWCCGGCFFFLLLRAGVLPFLFAACVLPFPPLLLRSFPFLFAACWRSSFSFCCVRSSFSFVAAAVVSFSFCCVLAFFLFLLLRAFFLFFCCCCGRFLFLLLRAGVLPFPFAGVASRDIEKIEKICFFLAPAIVRGRAARRKVLFFSVIRGAGSKKKRGRKSSPSGQTAEKKEAEKRPNPRKKEAEKRPEKVPTPEKKCQE